MSRARSTKPIRTPLAVALVAAGTLAAALPALGAPPDVRIAWQEHFDRPSLDWVDPMSHGRAELARIYSIRTDGGASFLHARHDVTAPSPPPALHYGKEFTSGAAPLDQVRALKWRWRVLHHPSLSPTQDAWADVAAALYVIVRQPGAMHGARGFKFGWLSKSARVGERQHGLIEEALRVDSAGPDWKSESVDLCALYQKEYGAPCTGEHVLYVGVVTDADDSKSLSEGDYADFELDVAP